jgi:hypothetical protein
LLPRTRDWRQVERGMMQLMTRVQVRGWQGQVLHSTLEAT